MNRRQVLQWLAAAPMAAAAMPSLADALKRDPMQVCAERFARNRPKHPVLAGWQSAPLNGRDWTRAELRGRWPKGFGGTLYRNGPGLFERAGQRYLHWFDGDGLLQAWRIGANGVEHRARFVETPKFRRENRAGKFEVMAAGTTVPNARAISGPDDVNTANISVLHVGDKSYALWEAGSAFEFNRDTLETIEIKTWREDLEGVAFSAHPVRDGDGSVWNVGLFLDRMVIYHVGADGTLRDAKPIKLPRGGYMHSFSASEKHLVFVLAPLVPVREAGSYFEGLGWRPERGSLMVVVPKSDLEKPSYLDFAAGAAYHYADAWDTPDGVCVRACWTDAETATRDEFVSPLQHFMQGDPRPQPSHGTRLVEIRANVQTKTARVVPLDDESVEFPVPLEAATRSPMLLLTGRASHPFQLLSGLRSLDANGKSLGHADLGDDIAIEEQLPVRHAGRDYALGTAFNAKKGCSGLVLFDLQRLADGPIAEAWLDHAMPLGFHGQFLQRG
jgi:all-trans-8'-apo-beta-carotenal 15,15'-oxygenase